VLLADFPVVPDVPSVANVPLAPNALLAQIPGDEPAAPALNRPATSTSARQPASLVKAVAAKTRPRKNLAAASDVKPAGVKSLAKAKRPELAAPHPLGKSVLKLDPLDVLSDRVGASDSFMDFSPAEDALRYNRQIAALESDLKALRVQSASNEKLMLELRTKLLQAEQNEIPAGLVYALLAALLASLLLVLWLWRARQVDKQALAREAPFAWWNTQEREVPDRVMTTAPPAKQPLGSASQADAMGTEPEAPVSGSVVVPGTAKATQAGPQKVPAAFSLPDVSELDIDLDLAFSEPMTLDGVLDNATANVPYETNSIRHIGLDSILDVRQQAEFFVSLGQTERALEILKKQIAESTEPNPLLYLDLISLYHSLGMKADFREQRDIFQLLFNGVIPDFPAYNLPSRDLESYPEVISVLTRLWPRVDALAFLSACIFHDEYRASRQTYDLAAFKDLLMLHALADAVVDHASPAYQNTNPLEFDEDGVAHAIEETKLPVVTGSLDLDFSALGTEQGNNLAPDFDLPRAPDKPIKTPL
jgi:hypothetical protein